MFPLSVGGLLCPGRPDRLDASGALPNLLSTECCRMFLHYITNKVVLYEYIRTVDFSSQEGGPCSYKCKCKCKGSWLSRVPLAGRGWVPLLEYMSL